MMRSTSSILRLFAALACALSLSGGLALSAAAQDDAGTPTANPAGAATGTLAVTVYTCGDAAAGSFHTDGSFSPGPACVQGGSAALSVDGGAPAEIADGTALTLDEGAHTVADSVLGLSAEVVVAADAATQLTVVLPGPPAKASVTPPPATGAIRVVIHLCPAAISTKEQFDAVGDFDAKGAACPVLTLPNDAGPDGAVNAKDPGKPLSFDVVVTHGAEPPASIANGDATFTPSQRCESDLAQDLNGDGDQTDCFDASDYGFKDIPQGTVAVTEPTAPEGHRFGALEFVPGSGDDAAVKGVDDQGAAVSLDTTGKETVTLHLFNFVKPAANRVSVIQRVCPASVRTKADFTAIGDAAKQMLLCPAVTLPGDDGPAGAAHGDQRAFDVTVGGTDGGSHALGDATFAPAKICETDLKEDLDGDGTIKPDVCLDASAYRFDGVLQGPGVVVTAATPPDGYVFGAAGFLPGSGDDSTLTKVTVKRKTVTLDTGADGDVTVQLYAFLAPAPTAEPTVGMVQVIELWCDGATEETIATALAPGADAQAGDLGDSTCVAGEADFQISEFGATALDPFPTGADGMAVSSGIPSTAGKSPHLITELSSGTSAAFDIQPGVTTRVIFLNYLPVAIVDSSAADGQAALDEGAAAVDNAAVDSGAIDDAAVASIDSGAGLAQTGIPARSGGGTAPILLFGSMGLLLLAAAWLRRRRSA